jgi:hypothetical protein
MNNTTRDGTVSPGVGTEDPVGAEASCAETDRSEPATATNVALRAIPLARRAVDRKVPGARPGA